MQLGCMRQLLSKKDAQLGALTQQAEAASKMVQELEAQLVQATAGPSTPRTAHQVASTLQQKVRIAAFVSTAASSYQHKSKHKRSVA